MSDLYYLYYGRWKFGLKKPSVIKTLSEVPAMFRNNVTMSLLLLKPCVMRSTFRSKACVMPSFKAILVVPDKCQLPKLRVQFFSTIFPNNFLKNSVGLLVCNLVDTSYH
jgi:hypothetical protein